KHNSFTGGYGGLLLDISILPQISEELFYFVTKNIPYLCGFWRFANAYIIVKTVRRKNNHDQGGYEMYLEL
ncbi:MAG: hypothetical protein MR332_14425, partial [Fusicatenibacter sp.]|nr:hypothetical protein [Fusicatenibacter sp.]